MWPNPGRQSNIIANKLVMVAQANCSRVPVPVPVAVLVPVPSSSATTSTSTCPALLAQLQMSVGGGGPIQPSLTREQRAGSVGRGSQSHIVCGQVCVLAICLSRCTSRRAGPGRNQLWSAPFSSSAWWGKWASLACPSAAPWLCQPCWPQVPLASGFPGPCCLLLISQLIAAGCSGSCCSAILGPRWLAPWWRALNLY